jgi:hypothetical protein
VRRVLPALAICFKRGGEMTKLVGAAGLLALLLACGRESAATQQIRSAAAVDLDCDESQIELVYDEPMVKRASGCGRTLTYMYKCGTSNGRQQCRWKPVRDPLNKLY